MSRPIEELLRDAYQAKAAQLTEARLDQLTAAREHGLDELLGTGEVSEHTAELPAIHPDVRPGRRPHRWIAPALAAAAVAAVAIGAVVIATDQPAAHQRPNPPASHGSSSPEPSSTPTPAPTTTPTATVAAPPYLPADQTGSRDQVPWSAVGPGWRLLQKGDFGRQSVYDRRLYLYDPAGGRYLITDALPSGVLLVGWSPDGDRAMVRSYDQGSLTSVYYQLQLRSGAISQVLRTGPANLVSYTRPHGLAFLIEAASDTTTWRLYRYSVDGGREFTYPASVNGGQPLVAGAFYSSDGSELVMYRQSDNSGVLVGNDGHFIRTFPNPPGFTDCEPIKLWTAAQTLERCTHVNTTPSHWALIVQPLSGAAPHVLADSQAGNTRWYQDAWPLSNGDVLLDNWNDCAGSTYDVLDGSTGVIRPLRWPPGIPPGSTIINMSGDVATFQHRAPGGCGNGVSQSTVYSYNMLTGQTDKLLDGDVMVLGWPGDPS